MACWGAADWKEPPETPAETTTLPVPERTSTSISLSSPRMFESVIKLLVMIVEVTPPDGVTTTIAGESTEKSSTM